MITSKAISTGGLGRFGNNCFTIAGVIGISTKSNQPYGFGPWKTFDNAIFGESVDNMSDHFVNPLPPVVDVPFQDYGYFWGFRDIYLPDGNWSIDAHLQDERYFKHCMPLIRETFRMKEEPTKWNDWTALHWRAGDYQADQSSYHPRLTIDYYKRAIELLPSDSKFLCFSDDIDALSNMIVSEYGHDYEGNRFVYVNGDYITSFKMMKTCKNFITANSSFSLFAAILGEHPEKKIVCPSKWFGAAAGSMVFDGYPEGAVVI